MTGLTMRNDEVGENIVIIRAKGFLDAHTYTQLEDAIETLFGEKKFKLIVELSGVDYISSAGAGVFIGAVGTATANGGNIIFLNPSPNVKEVFDLLGLSQIFPLVYNEQEAVTYFDEKA